MKIVVLTALIAAVASGPLTGQNSEQSQWPWQVGKLYRYEVLSHTLTRLQEGPSSGSAYKANFIVRTKAPNVLQAKLDNLQRAEVHEQLDNYMELPAELKYEPVQGLQEPFDILLSGGRVLSLRVPSALPLPQENLLKGFISTLQVDLSAHRLHTSQNNYDKETQQGQFKKMETDVTGDCMTLYTVSPVASEWRREIPQFNDKEEPIVITKTRNYDHCHHRVAYHFGVPHQAQWTGTPKHPSEEQFISRSYNARVLAGKQGPIYKAETTNRIHVHPHQYGEQKAEVHSYVKLQLITYEQDNEAEWQKAEEHREIQNLLYSVNHKQVRISDSSSSSSESNEQSAELGMYQKRMRRSVNTQRKIISINKIIEHQRRDSSSSDSSSHSESSSTYVNDEIPKNNQPAYAALYMNSQTHVDKKQNQMNAQKLLQELAQQLQNPNNMPKGDFLSKFNILVRVVASMSTDQLNQISNSIEAARASNNIGKNDMWMIYRDAVAQAGTLPAFKQIKSWVQSKKIQGEEAAEVVATLVYTLRYPTKEVMTEFFNLAISPEVSQQRYLNTTALVAATKLINMAQVNNDTAHSYYPTHMYGRLSRRHERFVPQEILPRLRQKLEESVKEGDNNKALVYIKATGNLGHNDILEVFKPYLEGKIVVSTYLRTEMVDNLKTLAYQKDKYARAVFYSILKNTAEHYEVRVAAIENVFIARPTGAMMQSMAHMTCTDPSIHVRAALKSAIESAAELKDPRYYDLAKTAQQAKWMLTKEKFGKQYSAKYQRDNVDTNPGNGIIELLSYIGSEDNLLPKKWQYTIRSRTSGWHEIASSFSSIDEFVNYFQEQMNKVWKRNPTAEPNHKYTAQKVAEMLNIKRDRQYPLEGSLYFDMMKQQRYFTFSEDDLKQLPQTMNNIISELSKGVNMHYTKVFNQAQVSVMFPVASGMPFFYKYKEPTVVHIQGKVKTEMPQRQQRKAEPQTTFKTEIHFTYARNIDGSVGFLDTLGNKFASAGIVNKIQVQIPIKVEARMQSKEVKINIEPLRPDQDTTVLHYSVWPYTAYQTKDSLTPVSLDQNSRPYERKTKVIAIDSKFGQQTGTHFQIQGYSYSKDYSSVSNMFQSSHLLPNIISLLYQNDVALTHFNFRYLGKQSQNKKATFIFAQQNYENVKPDANKPLVAANVEDVSPNSAKRRSELATRVASGYQQAYAKVMDLAAIFEGPLKSEYMFTGAIAENPVDRKLQYAFYAGSNTEKEGIKQINGVGKVNKPQVYVFNFLESLKKDLKMDFDVDIKFGQNQNGNIHIQGLTERSKKYADELQSLPLVKQCINEISENNYYQKACQKTIVLAHAVDQWKASVTYKDVNPAVLYTIYRAYRYAENYVFDYASQNPLKKLPQGKFEIEAHNDYLNHVMNMKLRSEYGEVLLNRVPIPKVAGRAFSTHFPLKSAERVFNYYFGMQYEPRCVVDGNKISTFSDRTYRYLLSPAWHVVMHQSPSGLAQVGDELVVLARRPNDQQQEIYISYKSETGKSAEINIQPSQNQANVNVKTDAEKASEGELTIYRDPVEESPFLQYYTQHDGVLVLTIRDNRLRVLYDHHRLVVLSDDYRNTTRGICGYMSGEKLDDYLIPQGLVDQPAHYAASYALNDEHSDPDTQKLQSEAKRLAYKPQHSYTSILQSDSEWINAKEDSSEKDSSDVYRARGYAKLWGPCKLEKQVQYYENHGEICITTKPLNTCWSHCRAEDYTVTNAQVVCRSKLDQEFQQYRNQIRQGQNPEVSGELQVRQYRVPTGCKA